jgi:hypothetical protein
MEKQWYQSKAVWGGLLVAAGGVFTAVGQFLQGTLDIQTLVTQIIPLISAGVALIGIRQAEK